MARSLVALGALDLTDTTDCVTVCADTQALLALIESHLHNEETHMHPVLQAAEPGVVGDTEAEPGQHRQAMVALSQAAAKCGGRLRPAMIER